MIPSVSLQLTITQQFGRLNVDHQKAKIEMTNPPALLEIRQPAATLEISQGRGQLEIDGSEARAALGHKTNGELIANIAHQARQVALQAIGDISAEGDQMMKIENKGNSIGNIAHQRWNNGPMPIEDTGPFHGSGVRVSYTPRETELHWDVHPDAEITATPQPVGFQFTPGFARPYVEQQNWLQIDVKGQYLNRTF